jgi:cell filamentation protein
MAKALSGDDPFFDYRHKILKNVPGYTDQAKLDKFERFTTAAAAVELELNPVRGSFDRPHLQQIHKRLFDEVYPWAGEPRPTDLRRPGFSWFVRKEFLGITLDNTLSALAAEKHLKGLNEETFSARAAHFLGDVNHIHVFREGNGRTQREFFRELAAEAGYRLNWGRVKPEQMNEASIQSHEHRDNSGLICGDSLLHRTTEGLPCPDRTRSRYCTRSQGAGRGSAFAPPFNPRKYPRHANLREKLGERRNCGRVGAGEKPAARRDCHKPEPISCVPPESTVEGR